MQLGCDIVDLLFTKEHNPRFVDRILSPEEGLRFPRIALEDPLLWKLWAAKESAYKAMKQLLDIPFHHREFLVDQDLSAIRYHDTALKLDVQQVGDRIFATAASLGVQTVISRFHAFDDEALPEEQSQQANELLLQAAAETLNLPRSELSLLREQRIPKLMHRGQKLPHPISLSHHGRYVAASLGF